MSKRLFVTLGLLLTTTLSGCSQAAPVSPPVTSEKLRALQLTLALDKTQYLWHEPIVAQFTLTNLGNGPELVNSRFATNDRAMLSPLREVLLLITNAAGTPAPFKRVIRITRPADTDFQAVLPGQSAMRAYDITHYFDLSQPGTYTVQAIYENRSNPSDGRSAWQGQLSSNSLTFTIAPPLAVGVSLLHLRMTLDKSQYTVGSAIYAQAILTNLGAQPELVNGRLAINPPNREPDWGELELVLTNSAGRRLPLTGEVVVSLPTDADFTLLASGEYGLGPAYALNQLFALTEPDTYTLQAIYRNTNNPSDGRRTWQGELRSNVVTFTIAAPLGP